MELVENNNFGEIKNYMGFMADSAMTKIKTEPWVDLGQRASKNKTQIAKTLKISRPKLYKSEAVLTDKLIKSRIIPFIYITDLIYELSDQDEQKVLDWLATPNHLFLNTSPFDMCMAGRSETVIKVVEGWSGVKKEEK